MNTIDKALIVGVALVVGYTAYLINSIHIYIH
jgi:hypothetical protein